MKWYAARSNCQQSPLTLFDTSSRKVPSFRLTYLGVSQPPCTLFAGPLHKSHFPKQYDNPFDRKRRLLLISLTSAIDSSGKPEMNPSFWLATLSKNESTCLKTFQIDRGERTPTPIRSPSHPLVPQSKKKKKEVKPTLQNWNWPGKFNYFVILFAAMMWQLNCPSTSYTPTLFCIPRLLFPFIFFGIETTHIPHRGLCFYDFRW